MVIARSFSDQASVLVGHHRKKKKLVSLRNVLQSRLFVGCFAVIASFGVFSSAMAKPSTKERITTLETEVAELKAAAQASAASAQRTVALEEQVRKLTGQVETLTFQLRQSNARVDALAAVLAGTGDLPAGFPTSSSAGMPPANSGGGSSQPSNGGPTSLTGRSSGEPADLPTGSPGETPNDVQLPMDPEAAFIYANSFLAEQDYARAEAAYKMFLEVFKDHPRAEDVQFRLGEIYLARNKNTEAADAFVAFIRKYPDSRRLPEAYFKLGTAFAKLGQQGEACRVFQAVKSKYPNAPAALLEKTDRELSRNECR
ncbi:MAG: tetratricopeptide repeat protein [Pseudomonadota bacterium]